MSSGPLPPWIEQGIADVAAVRWGQVRYAWSLPVSSPYGPRIHPITGAEQFHSGVDIPVPYGTPVLAVFDGEIGALTEAGEGRGVINGNGVSLKVGPFTFWYLHLSEIDVREGDSVCKGRILGRVGATGRATGPHLHFQCYYGGYTVNPAVFYPGGLLS